VFSGLDSRAPTSEVETHQSGAGWSFTSEAIYLRRLRIPLRLLMAGRRG